MINNINKLFENNFPDDIINKIISYISYKNCSVCLKKIHFFDDCIKSGPYYYCSNECYDFI